MKITETSEIAAAFKNFQPNPEGASPSGRRLSGQWKAENCQEWVEVGSIDGQSALVTYMFENSEADVEDGADIQFDAAHITQIDMQEEVEA